MQKSQGWRTAWAGALVICACGVAEAPEDARQGTAQRREAIVGGTIAPGDPAVVVLAVGSSGSYQEFCTGTLIGPKTVLTAAHCIAAYGPGYPYVVGFGPNIYNLTRVIAVADQVADPSYRGEGWDFGLMRLSQAVAEVTPIAISERPLSSSDVGRTIRHVGFGITSASGAGGGTKREVTYAVRDVLPLVLESGASGKQTCSGDSGGPGFMVLPGESVEKVVGVVSYGDQNCATDGYDGRVDVGAAWVKATMATWEQPTCATDGACVPGCAPVDQDCACVADGRCTAECADPGRDPDCPRDCIRNGVCAQADCPVADPDCVASGTPCTVAQVCRERLCGNDPQHPQSYCSNHCASSADCPASLECASGTCRYPQLPQRALLERCAAREDYCMGSICTGPAGGVTRCVLPCLVSTDCPSGSVCEAGGDSQRYCRPGGLRFSPTVLPAAAEEKGPAVSGCSAAGAGLPSLGLLGLALSLLRRRSRGGR